MNRLLIVPAILAVGVHSFIDINFSGVHLHTDTNKHGDETPEKIAVKYYTQKLDHFNLSIVHTFQQRYFQREEFWKKDGPIFIVIGGEDDTRRGDVFGGIAEQLPAETDGVLFALEHRYYGVSVPYQLEHNVLNMQYLSSRQALADLADFIIHLKDQEKYKNSKVVVIGSSYAGSLAAWMRAKYPNLVDAAIASSAPLVAKTNFKEYLETVGKVYRKYGGDQCYRNIKLMSTKINSQLLKKDEAEKLKKSMNVCAKVDIHDKDNQYYLKASFSSELSAYVQYGSKDTIKDYCNSFAELIKNDSLLIMDTTCLNIDYKKYLRMNRLDPWLYQQCTEFGFQQTSASDKQPFFKSIGDVDYFYKECSSLFGEEFNRITIERAINQTNSYYGGLGSIPSRVVFTHGSIDPWATLGVTYDQYTMNTPVIVIEDASHSEDLSTETENDSEYMKINRGLIKFWIKYWLDNEEESRSDQW